MCYVDYENRYGACQVICSSALTWNDHNFDNCVQLLQYLIRGEDSVIIVKRTQYFCKNKRERTYVVTSFLRPSGSPSLHPQTGYGKISLALFVSYRARLPIPPTATLPSCLWSLRISLSLPGSRLGFFIAIFFND